jgi:HAD superfamily hydrolase (TIGR01458 family)
MRVEAVLLDVDGVLTVSWQPIPGAVDALARLRDAGLGVAFLTNTTSRSRTEIAAALVEAGFSLDVDEVFTAATIGAAYLRETYPGARVLLLNSGDVRVDFEGVTLVADTDADRAAGGGRPDVVVLGGAGEEFGYEQLNQAFGYVVAGAPLVALHRNLVWRTSAGLQLDTGAFLAGLERAAGVEATVVGKPAGAFFDAALNALGVDPAGAVMVGDDVEHDVLGAQAHGVTGVLVQTGKFRESDLVNASGTPDHVVPSVADVPALLAALNSAAGGRA